MKTNTKLQNQAWELESQIEIALNKKIGGPHHTLHPDSRDAIANFIMGVREKDSITEIPDNTIVANDPYKHISSKLTKIGENVVFEGDALIQKTSLKKLPDKMIVHGSIYLPESIDIRSISDGVIVMKQIVQDKDGRRTRVSDLKKYKIENPI